ncbi:MAG: SBBP repeat-containing protein [Candidatus Latescibacteria bacterium]|nr:SBBP repeat-containing protein [Candidatus Latescibacterota bacterium]
MFISNSYLLAQVDTSWVRRFNEPVSGIDYASAITVDSAGNAYITGWSGTAGIPDYLTIKMNATGQIEWMQTYNGPDNSGDWAYAIAVDAQGNVYVTGESEGLGTSTDYATVKYNAMGIEQWVARYNGPANGSDWANAIKVDAQGNVYVTGASDGGSSDYDYLTIKYSANGQEQWVRRYNGTGNGDDIANCLAIDAAGNVYVSGESEGDENDDYITIKYNAQGVQQWLNRYDGIGDSYDYAYGIAVDAQGNVYVTGASGDDDADFDYATVKYNANGVQQWVRRYDGTGNDDDFAYAIALDAQGNIYVTGTSFGITSAYDYATVKYNSAGTRQWTARYNGTGNSWDYPEAIAVDNVGNVYITGDSYGLDNTYDYVTIKYNTSGIEQWVQRYQGTGNGEDYVYGLGLDAQNNVYVTGGSVGLYTESDYLTVKYSSAGNPEWSQRYDGQGNSIDQASALIIDQYDNAYVTGSSTGSGTGSDYLTVKYNNVGVQEWAVRYNGLANGNDNAYAIANDIHGNVYVTGTSYGVGTNYDIATVKYDLNGNQQWSVRYNGPRNLYDWANAIAVDNAGNVYVTGGSEGIGTDFDCVTIKYNAAGQEQWVQRYNGIANSIDYANAIAIDIVGNVYIAGVCFSPGSSYNYLTIKYNSEGIMQWSQTYNGTANGSDAATAIAVDELGNVYVTGRNFGTNTNRDYVTIKYNSQGQEQWVQRYNGTGNGEDAANAIAVDNFANVYVTGSSIGAGSGRDYTTIKYNAAGQEQWVQRYNGTANGDDVAYALFVDNWENVYATGASHGIGSSVDYLTVKYDANGNEQWTHRYNGLRNRYDRASAIAVNSSGMVFITGTSEGFGTGNDIVTIKYLQTSGLVEDNISISEPNLFSISPNPFSSQTTIKYTLHFFEPVSLQIFDITGRAVKMLVNDLQLRGKYNIIWDGKDQKGNVVKQGVYFSILKIGDQQKQKKIILLK